MKRYGRTIWARFKRLLLLSILLAAFVGLVIWAAGCWIREASEPLIYGSVDDVPRRWIAIVPGAAVKPGGRPSTILRDRLEAARQLYRKRKVRRILVSGDNRTRHYNETRAMKRWLIRQGVQARHIYSDFAGFRTLDTMERAARVFEVDDAVVCTQAFHLPRSVFLAREAGIDAVGLVADQRRYRAARLNRFRESLALPLALADTYLWDRGPRFLGRAIPVTGPPQR